FCASRTSPPARVCMGTRRPRQQRQERQARRAGARLAPPARLAARRPHRRHGRLPVRGPQEEAARHPQAKRGLTIMSIAAVGMTHDSAIHKGTGRTKIEQFGWEMIDSEGSFALLDKRLLNVDPSYQRDQTLSACRDMAREWCWMACGALVVA